MEQPFIPELGQSVLGQDWQSLKPNGIEEDLLAAMCTMYYILRPSNDNPFQNTGGRFRGKRIDLEAYSWDVNYDQPYNLKWRDWLVSWYKHCGRGVSLNRHLTEKERISIFEEFMQDIAISPPQKSV